MGRGQTASRNRFKSSAGTPEVQVLALHLHSRSGPTPDFGENKGPHHSDGYREPMAWISSSPQPCDSGCSTCGSRSITDHDESCTSTLSRAQLPAGSSSNCARPSPAVLAKEIRPERALTSRAQQDRPSAQPARDRRRSLEIYVEQLYVLGVPRLDSDLPQFVGLSGPPGSIFRPPR